MDGDKAIILGSKKSNTTASGPRVHVRVYWLTLWGGTGIDCSQSSR